MFPIASSFTGLRHLRQTGVISPRNLKHLQYFVNEQLNFSSATHCANSGLKSKICYFTTTTTQPAFHPNAITEQALLSYRELQHSMKFLSFFSHYAASLYEFTNVEFMKKFFPIVLTIQGLVYNADYEIEQGQKDPALFSGIQPWVSRKSILMRLLKEIGMYTPEIEKEADHLSEYWLLENQLILGIEITHEKLLDAIRLRPSDVMMLHHVCQKKAEITLNPEVWKAIQAIEIIRDIEADLRQYENDVKTNDFNIYRMFIRLYKQEARNRLQNELDHRKAVYRKIIAKLPHPFYAKFADLTNRYYKERPPIQVPEAIK